MQVEFMQSVCRVANHSSSQVRNCAVMCIIAGVDQIWNFAWDESSSSVHPIRDDSFFDLITRIHEILPTLELNSPVFKSKSKCKVSSRTRIFLSKSNNEYLPMRFSV